MWRWCRHLVNGFIRMGHGVVILQNISWHEDLHVLETPMSLIWVFSSVLLFFGQGTFHVTLTSLTFEVALDLSVH